MISPWSQLAWDITGGLVEWFNLRPSKAVPEAELEEAHRVIELTLALLRDWNTREPVGEAAESGWPMTDPARWAHLERTFSDVYLRLALCCDRRGRVEVQHGIVRPSELDRGLDLLARASRFHLLDRVRKCKRCRKWFLARRRKQLFCSAECQQETWSEYRKTPAGLKEQADRLRLWREKKRVGQEKQKAEGRKRR